MRPWNRMGVPGSGGNKRLGEHVFELRAELAGVIAQDRNITLMKMRRCVTDDLLANRNEKSGLFDSEKHIVHGLVAGSGFRKSFASHFVILLGVLLTPGHITYHSISCDR